MQSSHLWIEVDDDIAPLVDLLAEERPAPHHHLEWEIGRGGGEVSIGGLVPIIGVSGARYRGVRYP